jgi:hypothetical protein
MKIIIEIKNRKIKKINDWYRKFIKRTGFKTVRVIIPRTLSLKENETRY